MPRRKKRAPEVIDVCGRRVRINYHPTMPEEYALEDGNFIAGDLEINVDLSAERSPEQILLHELIHAILAYTGHSGALDDTQEEGLVSALEQNLIQHITVRKRKPWSQK
jgi:hypothetical protein